MVQASPHDTMFTAKRLPAGSCDCHFHIFDHARYPYAAQRSYTPPDATLASYQALCAQWGIDRAVLIHPSVFGADHRSFEELLQHNAAWLRGVAVAFPDTPDVDIERWHALGSRGSRINALFAGGPGLAALRSLADKVRPLGWHLQLLIDLVESPTLPQQVADLGLPVVVDHLGHHEVGALLKSAGLANLLSLMAEGRAWVKLSGPYRASSQQPRYAELDPLVERLVRANPARAVWGTDWPHPSSSHPLPSDAALIDRVFDWLPDAGLRQQILVDNPTALYWADQL